jgi:hypothetical protein
MTYWEIPGYWLIMAGAALKVISNGEGTGMAQRILHGIRAEQWYITAFD